MQNMVLPACGIAPVYGDKYMKKAIRIGDLLQPEALKNIWKA